MVILHLTCEMFSLRNVPNYWQYVQPDYHLIDIGSLVLVHLCSKICCWLIAQRRLKWSSFWKKMGGCCKIPQVGLSGPETFLEQPLWLVGCEWGHELHAAKDTLCWWCVWDDCGLWQVDDLPQPCSPHVHWVVNEVPLSLWRPMTFGECCRLSGICNHGNHSPSVPSLHSGKGIDTQGSIRFGLTRVS